MKTTTPSEVRRLIGKFVRDESGMSRADCLFIQLVLVVGIAAGVYAFGERGEPATGEAAMASPSEADAVIFGLTGVEITLSLLAVVALIFVVRLVVELRR